MGAANHHASVTRDDDRVAPYSSAGPTWYDGLVKPDFVAPGHMLVSEAAPNSALYQTYPTLRKKGKEGRECPYCQRVVEESRLSDKPEKGK